MTPHPATAVFAAPMPAFVTASAAGYQPYHDKLDPALALAAALDDAFTRHFQLDHCPLPVSCAAWDQAEQRIAAAIAALLTAHATTTAGAVAKVRAAWSLLDSGFDEGLDMLRAAVEDLEQATQATSR